ncbi:Deoxyribonuclease TatD [Klebsiella pneumoniae]|uniref:Deoxyribonuclease TatD n=1 Tax=Klebsiella pneumoniae TaxID=573 RepID=A0A378ATR7_KLEPN|nr:Deoxyribonuclease TatD [Klebsiella pneumoniae]
MFDIGVNLTSSQFSRDHDEVVARALAAGVNGMLLTGTNLAESQQAQKLASPLFRLLVHGGGSSP